MTPFPGVHKWVVVVDAAWWRALGGGGDLWDMTTELNAALPHYVSARIDPERMTGWYELRGDSIYEVDPIDLWGLRARRASERAARAVIRARKGERMSGPAVLALLIAAAAWLSRAITVTSSENQLLSGRCRWCDGAARLHTRDEYLDVEGRTVRRRSEQVACDAQVARIIVARDWDSANVRRGA